MNQFTPPQQEQTVRVNIAELEDVKCDECGDRRFEPVYLVKRMSPLHPAAQGEERLIPLGPPVVPPIFACYKCGHINESFLPVPLRSGLAGAAQSNEPILKTSLDIMQEGDEPAAGSSPDTERK